MKRKKTRPQNSHQQTLEVPAFPYDPTPMTNHFPGNAESCFDMVNQYGTYNIQPTADTENFFPAVAQGLAADADVPNRPEK